MDKCSSKQRVCSFLQPHTKGVSSVLVHKQARTCAHPTVYTVTFKKWFSVKCGYMSHACQQTDLFPTLSSILWTAHLIVLA